jgi:hypothetical protein
MRWTSGPEPEVGIRRTKTWFALLPVSIGRGHPMILETRWLETVRVEQVLRRGGLCNDLRWESVRFVDEQE